MTTRPCIRARLAAGERVYGTMVFELFTPGLTAILAEAGLDFVILDTEHSGVGIETLKQQVAYARGLPIEVYARVPSLSYAAVATVLDAGVKGVMVPMLETPEQARDLVTFARYRPEGKRGCAFAMPHDAYKGGDVKATMASANAENLLIALIETKKGIANADAILGTPGIDVGWVGHFDLTDDMGITADFEHADFWAAIDTLAAAAKKHKKTLAGLDVNPAYLQKLHGKGFKMLGFGMDTAVLKTAYAKGMEQLKAFG